MKSINDICIVVQARMGSQRVPRKMLKPFNNTTLVDILLSKLTSSKVIPQNNIVFSAYEQELKEVVSKYNITVFNRSKESASAETSPPVVFEWWNKIPYKYVILVSACNPLLKLESIEKFYLEFLNSKEDSAFGVFEKKTYYWDKDKNSITDYKGLTGMNTKLVDPVYEAAHCLYASRLDIIGDGFWMSKTSPPTPQLVVINELESFDIDEQWQFDIAEQLYKNNK
jgi:CMP-N-acetylneuraminic acid synthetase